MNEVKGYCLIKKDAKTGISVNPISEFVGNPMRILDFGCDESVLIVNREATALATFDKCDVDRLFKCSVYCNLYILPAGLNLAEQMIYVTKCQFRKGGYDYIIKNMVIAASLHKNEFNDNFLWQKL